MCTTRLLGRLLRRRRTADNMKCHHDPELSLSATVLSAAAGDRFTAAGPDRGALHPRVRGVQPAVPAAHVALGGDEAGQGAEERGLRWCAAFG